MVLDIEINAPLAEEPGTNRQLVVVKTDHGSKSKGPENVYAVYSRLIESSQTTGRSNNDKYEYMGSPKNQ